MRRKLFTIGTTAMVAASLWVAPAAGAAETDSCDPGTPPEQTTVTNEGHVLQINPGNAPGDAVALATWARPYVLCLVGEATNNDVVQCVENYVANRPTVSIDPEGPSVTIDYSALLNTACQV